MAKQVKVIVLRTAGTNCDRETVFAFESFGAEVSLIHINRVFRGEVKLKDFHILAIPGGFSYGDDIMAGKILANELKLRLGDDIRRFIDDGKLVIGICNGFQVLVRAGILPGSADSQGAASFRQTVSLTFNDCGKFEDRWIHLRASGKSVWTEGLDPIVYYPVAHAEGKFVAGEKGLIDDLNSNGQVLFRYCGPDGEPAGYPANPNGSEDAIAGISDPTGRVLGMMPHPERHFLRTQHPSWTRTADSGPFGQGAKIFENGVQYVKKHLLSIPLGARAE